MKLYNSIDHKSCEAPIEFDFKRKLLSFDEENNSFMDFQAKPRYDNYPCLSLYPENPYACVTESAQSIFAKFPSVIHDQAIGNNTGYGFRKIDSEGSIRVTPRRLLLAGGES